MPTLYNQLAIIFVLLLWCVRAVMAFGKAFSSAEKWEQRGELNRKISGMLIRILYPDSALEKDIKPLLISYCDWLENCLTGMPSNL